MNIITMPRVRLSMTPVFIKWIVFFALIFRVDIPLAEGLVIIANPSVPVSTLTSQELNNIYTGKIKLWDNGEHIVVVFSKQKDTQINFLKSYINKTPSQFVNYWRNLIFTGKSSTIPKGLTNEDELITYVALTKGAIGYVSADRPLDKVKPISINQ